MILDLAYVEPVVPRQPSYALGHVDVVLSEEDEALAVKIAKTRDDNAKAHGWKPILGLGTERAHLAGVRGEFAICRAYDAEWIDPERLDPNRQHDPDVGGVDVRASEWTSAAFMPIRQRDAVDRAHVFVIIGGGRLGYRIVGWTFGHDARRSEWWQEPDGRGPGYWQVPLSALMDPAWLPIRRVRR